MHELQRKEKARLIAIENAQLAIKLISLKSDQNLRRTILEQEHDKHLKAKNNLCKLPVIDMSRNRLKYTGAADRGNDQSSRLSIRSSKSKPRASRNISTMSSKRGSRPPVKIVKLNNRVKNYKEINSLNSSNQDCNEVKEIILSIPPKIQSQALSPKDTSINTS